MVWHLPVLPKAQANCFVLLCWGLDNVIKHAREKYTICIYPLCKVCWYCPDIYKLITGQVHVKLRATYVYVYSALSTVL